MKANLRTFHGVLVGQGTALAEALSYPGTSRAEAVFKATSERYRALYSAEDRLWFATASKDLSLVRQGVVLNETAEK